MNEYEHEPIRGLPEVPPEGERILWQGAPRWRSLARRAFHTDLVAIYFAVLIVAHGASRWVAGDSWTEIALGTSWQLALAALTIGILALLAYLYGRTTVYTITNRRLVMRFGVALPMMINLPWSRIDAVDLRRYADGSGDLVLTTASDERVSYWLIWPNVRPWHFSQVQPMLRTIEEPEKVAAALGELLRDVNAGATKPADEEPARGYPLSAAGA